MYSYILMHYTNRINGVSGSFFHKTDYTQCTALIKLYDTFYIRMTNIHFYNSSFFHSPIESIAEVVIKLQYNLFVKILVITCYKKI